MKKYHTAAVMILGFCVSAVVSFGLVYLAYTQYPIVFLGICVVIVSLLIFGMAHNHKKYSRKAKLYYFFVIK